MSNGILVITDSHYGWNRSKADSLQNSVNETIEVIKSLGYNEPDKIILLGDIFDFWRSDIDTIFNNFIDDIKYILDNKDNIIYIYGNHDIYLTKIFNKNEIKLLPHIIYNGVYFSHGFIDEIYYGFNKLDLETYKRIAYILSTSRKGIKTLLSKVWYEYKLVSEKVGHNLPDEELCNLLHILALKYGRSVIGHFHRYMLVSLDRINNSIAVSLAPHCNGFTYYLYKNKIIEINTNKSYERVINLRTSITP